MPPLGVPVSVSLSFWAGLWGIVYAAAEPRLTARFGRIAGGLLFGIAPLVARWFVVLPLKGLPVVEGFVPAQVGVFVGFHLVFGLGLAIILPALLGLFGRAPARRAIQG